MIHRSFRKNAMAEVKDMARARAGAAQQIVYLRAKLRQRCEQRLLVERVKAVLRRASPKDGAAPR